MPAAVRERGVTAVCTTGGRAGKETRTAGPREFWTSKQIFATSTVRLTVAESVSNSDWLTSNSLLASATQYHNREPEGILH